MNRLSQKTCVVCGAAFMGGSTARFCPTCREARKKEQDRKRTKGVRARARKIGSTDICQCCGTEYVVRGGAQKYCPGCQQKMLAKWRQESYHRLRSDPAKLKKAIARSRAWALSHPHRMQEILRASYDRTQTKRVARRRLRGFKMRPLGRIEICPACGKEFVVDERNRRYCRDCRPPRKRGRE